MTGLNSKSNLY